TSTLWHGQKISDSRYPNPVIVNQIFTIVKHTFMYQHEPFMYSSIFQHSKYIPWRDENAFYNQKKYARVDCKRTRAKGLTTSFICNQAISCEQIASFKIINFNKMNCRRQSM